LRNDFTTRTLLSNDEETIIDTKRPIMLNGINNVIRRHDVADRSIIIDLAVIPDEKRIPEADFWQDFGEDAPEILGAILDAVSCSLRNYKTVRLPRTPRLSDFAIWVTAAEPALGWEEGTFLKAYSVSRREITALTLYADQAGTAVKTFMERRSFETWEGTVSELLDALDGQIDYCTRKGKSWPRSANALSGKVKRSATALRAEGIGVTIGHDRQNKKRFMRLEHVPIKIVPNSRMETMMETMP
jgi:putative DNA primase/helicase